MNIRWPTKKSGALNSLRKATDKQMEYSRVLDLNLKTKSFRVASAMIADEIEKRCWKSIN